MNYVVINVIQLTASYVQPFPFAFRTNPLIIEIDSRRSFDVWRLFDFDDFLFLDAEAIAYGSNGWVTMRGGKCGAIGLLTLTGVYNNLDELFACFSNPFCGISIVSAVLLNVHLNDFGGGNESTSQRMRTASFRPTP